MTSRSRTLLWTAAVAGAVYVLAWIGWSARWPWLVSFDEWALELTYRVGAAHPAWVTTWNAVCDVLSPVTFRAVVVAVIAFALIRRQWRLALYLVVAVELTGVVTELLKRAADRPRPVTALVDASSTSFPSGHALGTTAAVLALLALGLPVVAPAWRGWLIGLGAAVIVVVGIGRVVLNVHHPTDVVAGWAFGYLYFVVCWWAFRRQRVTAADETPATPDSAP